MYTEKAPISSLMKFFLWGIFCVLLAAAVFSNTSLFGFGESSEEGYTLIAGLVIYTIAIQGILRLDYSVSPEAVVVGYPPLKYRIPLSEIEAVEPEPGLPFYTGRGLRIHGKTLIFASSHDRGVRIRKNNGYFREVILVSRDPENLKMQIENMTGNAGYHHGKL
jgi:hypothetical protein